MNETHDAYARWRAADQEGRDDEADRACQAMFHTLDLEEPVWSAFTTRTMAAVAAAAARDARRARLTRAALVSAAVIGGSAAAYYGTGWAVSFLASAFIGLLNVMVGVIARVAAGLDAGSGLWALLSSLGRAAMAFAADPKVSFVILAIPLIAMAALFALQRLLGSDLESFE